MCFKKGKLMSLYSLSKYIKMELQFPDQTAHAKVSFKTKESTWIDSENPVIIPISLHSIFHDEYKGEIKMNALISVIKDHVKGPITILMTEKAHLHALSLKYNHDYTQAWQECLQASQNLSSRYADFFKYCQVSNWNYISEDKNYEKAKHFILSLFDNDAIFREYLYKDALSTYTTDRAEVYLDQPLFIQKTIEDIIEQCSALLVMAIKGYRFLFYPGAPLTSQEYVRSLFPKETPISWISVFLNIEKRRLQDKTAPTKDDLQF